MKKIKNISNNKVLSMLLAFTIACSVFLPVTASAKGREDAEIIMLGDTISGVSIGDYSHEYFYFEVPARMNISLKGYISGIQPFDRIRYHNQDGTEKVLIWWNDKKAWTYNRPREKSYLKHTITLNKGKYYISLPHTPDIKGKSYSIKIEGKLSADVRVSKVKKTSRTSAKISWNKIRGINGYEIYRSSGKKGAYQKIATVKGRSYTNKKLKKNRTYYYKVRAYIMVKGNKYYSRYSSPKKIRM